MNPFQKIKNRIEENAEQKNEEQRQRIERLAELEAAQNRKGFHIPNPVQSMKNKKEIKKLKKEIAAFEESKRDTKIISGCIAFVVILICSCGIMAAVDGESPSSKPEASVSNFEQETVEDSLSTTVDAATVPVAEAQPAKSSEDPPQEATSAIETTEALSMEDSSVGDLIETQPETIPLSPQRFRITWSAQLVDSNHVGSNWSKLFEVNDETFSSGSVVTVDPNSQFTIRLTIQENDSNPDTDYYFERIAYSEELCTNGHTVSETLYVRENGGRYSGNCAEWNITITLTPVQ